MHIPIISKINEKEYLRNNSPSARRSYNKAILKVNYKVKNNKSYI